MNWKKFSQNLDLAHNFMNQMKFNEAIDILKVLLLETPRKDWMMAASMATDAIVYAYYNRALQFLNIENIQSANIDLNQVIQQANLVLINLPNSPYLLLYSGLAYSQLKMYDQALNLLYNAINNGIERMFPDLTWGTIGDCYYAKFDMENAFNALNRALNYNRQNAVATYLLGHIYFYYGNFNKSIELYQEASRLNPNINVSNDIKNAMEYGKYNPIEEDMSPKIEKESSIQPIQRTDTQDETLKLIQQDVSFVKEGVIFIISQMEEMLMKQDLTEEYLRERLKSDWEKIKEAYHQCQSGEIKKRAFVGIILRKLLPIGASKLLPVGAAKLL